MAVDSDIDLERVVFDPEYRRDVIARLNVRSGPRERQNANMNAVPFAAPTPVSSFTGRGA
jgi:hypothetical protein